MKMVESSVDADAPRETCYEVLVDFERYPEFLDDHESAAILERSDDVVLVEWTVQIVKELTYVCRQHLDPPRGLRWEFVRGDLKDTKGGWRLEELGDDRTRAHYEIGVDVGGFVPSFVQSKLVETTLPKTLDRFRRRFEAIAAE